MESKQKIVLTIVGLVVLVIVFYYAAMGITKYTGKVITGNVISELSIENFAKCLSEKGVKMYGARTCSHCENQKELFGDSFQYINYVECLDTPDICISRGIEYYPAWDINGQLDYGTQTLQKLAELSGCKIE